MLTRKFAPALLSVALVAGACPAAAFAAESADAESASTVAYELTAAADTSSAPVITFSASGISATSTDGVKISGTTLTIQQAGTYVITGSCSEGNIKVKKNLDGNVVLVLRNLSLACSTTAPLAVNKSEAGATKVTLQVEGTVTLTDAEDPNNEYNADGTENEDYEGAAIKAKSGTTLTVTGTGTLNVKGNAKNGIKGGATATVNIGASTSDTVKVNVTATNHGVAADGSVVVNGGTLTINAGNEGIKASPDDDDTVSAGTITVNGGTLNVTAADDGIHADGDVTMLGGTTTVSAGDDGIKSEYGVVIGAEGATSGPTVKVTKSNEGIEGATVDMNAGTVSVVASDDGVNAANSDFTSYDFQLNINGGKLYVNAGGDGLDSNGTIAQTGGVAEVFGSANAGNAAIDYGDTNGAWTVTGGTMLAVGMSGMAVVPTSGTYVAFGTAGMGGMGMGAPMGAMAEDGTDALAAASDDMSAQAPSMGGVGSMPSMGGQMGQMGQMGVEGQQGQASSSTVSISNGSTIAVKDASGNTLYTATGVKSANSVVFYSDALQSGQTYSLYVNGTQQAQATAGTGTGQAMGMGGMPGQMGQDGTFDPSQMGQGQFGQQGMPGMPGDMGQFGQNQAITGYPDVAATDWVYTEGWLSYVTKNGLMTGYQNGIFGQYDQLTRGQVATVLYRYVNPGSTATTVDAASQVNTTKFTDNTDGQYFTAAMNWAYEQGIFTGDEGASTVRPGDGITRQELATVLYRFAAAQGASATSAGASAYAAAPDASAVSAWATDALGWCYANKVLTGNGDTGLLDPWGVATRAHMAKMITVVTRDIL